VIEWHGSRKVCATFHRYHTAPPATFANANSTIKGYDSDSSRLSINDVPPSMCVQAAFHLLSKTVVERFQGSEILNESPAPESQLHAGAPRERRDNRDQAGVKSRLRSLTNGQNALWLDFVNYAEVKPSFRATVRLTPFLLRPLYEKFLENRLESV
jgi:hypothetical protein